MNDPDPLLRSLGLPGSTPGTRCQWPDAGRVWSAGGADVGPLLALWAESEAIVHVALLPLDESRDWEEGAAQLAPSGAAFLVATTRHACLIFSDRPLPGGVERWARRAGHCGLNAFVREAEGREAVTLFEGLCGHHLVHAWAGGVWAAASAVRGES